ncbi:hypothetical protein PLESTM_001418700, partial [Pleodorina starrii]
MPESEVLLGSIPRSDQPAGTSAAGADPGRDPDLQEHGRRDSTSGPAAVAPAAPSTEHRPPSLSASSTIDDEAVAVAPRRPSIWTLPFCAPGTSWLHVSNAIVYLVAFCINVLVNSGAVWRSVRSVDSQYGPIMTPARWSYHIRDLMLFLWGLAVAAQNLAEHKGWKDGLMSVIGHSWQILWYSDSIWLVLHVVASPTGLTLAPLFSMCALLSAVATQARVAVALPGLHQELQAEGYPGIPALGYLLFVFPTSLASGWLLVHHCHTITLATLVITGSEQAALTAGCVSLAFSTALALLMLVKLRDVVFGLAFTWSCVAVWVAGFASQDDYRPDQLTAFFCALVLGLLTYCVAVGPQMALVGE